MSATAEVILFHKKEEAKFISSACGADRGCNCNAPAVEKLAEKMEQQRQASKAYRERKAEVKEQLRQLAPSEARLAGAALRELRAERRQGAQEKAEEKQQPRHMTGNDVDPGESAEERKRAAEEDGPIREVDADEWKAQEKARLKTPLSEENEDEDGDTVTIGDWQKELRRADGLEKRLSDVTEALRAKEKTEGRDWPADMKPKQIKKRDEALAAIAFWQRALEKLYNEATGQPAWRVEMTAKDGQRLGNGLRFSTRGEAEFYRSRIAEESDGAEVEILACDGEKGNVSVSGTNVHFEHGDCVLFNWRPLDPH
jgi:hypothetical protein